MDVNRSAARVRPETGVDLLGFDQLVDDASGLHKERPELGSLLGVQFRDARDMSFRLDDQRPDAERPDRVLDKPTCSLFDDAAGKRKTTIGEIAGEATFHGTRLIGRSEVGAALPRRHREMPKHRAMNCARRSKCAAFAPKRAKAGKAGFCEVNSAATYSPGRLPSEYHRRWRA